MLASSSSVALAPTAAACGACGSTSQPSHGALGWGLSCMFCSNPADASTPMGELLCSDLSPGR